MRSIRPVMGHGVAGVVVAVVMGTGCSGSDVADNPADGVVLLAGRDLSGEPADVVFAAVPDLLVTEDGRAIYAAPAEYAFQGTLVPDVWVAAVSLAGVQLVRESLVAGTAPRNIDEIGALVGPELGDVERYSPDTFRFAAVDIGPAADFDDPDTPVVEWPATASLALADATECTRLPELEVGEVFVTAAENSVFVDDGVVYGVVAAPDWPGAPCVLPSGFEAGSEND